MKRPGTSHRLRQSAEEPASQIAQNFTHTREMLKKHQTLSRYYEKHQKSSKELAERKELREYYLDLEKEQDDEKKVKMNMVRTNKKKELEKRVEKRWIDKESRG